MNLTIPFDSDPLKEVQTVNFEEPIIPSATFDSAPFITQDLPSSSMRDKFFPQGKESVSAEELEAFSSEFDNLLRDISEVSYTTRTSALIIQ